MKSVRMYIMILLALILISAITACDGTAIPDAGEISPSPAATEVPILLTLSGEWKTTVDLGSEYWDPGATCLYGGADISSFIKTESTVDTSKPGRYTVTYALTYMSRRYIVKRLVNVVDLAAPEITLSGETAITVYKLLKYKEPGFSACDNCDGDITDKVKVTTVKISDNESKIIYTIADSSGNESRAERYIRYKEPDSKDIIYLTFDDGPHWKITPLVLDILKQYDVRATFFMLNFDDDLIPIVKRIDEEGHGIAIHGYIHYYKEIYKSEEAYLENLKKMQDRIKEVTGTETYLTRFPFGSYNTISNFNPGIMEKLRKRVPEEGYIYYDWNVSTGDGVSSTSKEDIIKYYKNGLKKGRNNIVLMHDSWGHENTIAALPEIIEYGIENGYTFGVITEQTPPLY